MIDFIAKHFFTENANCELLSFGVQPLNVLSNFAFLVVAYALYRQGGVERRLLAFAILISALGSFLHHLLPTDWTVPFDMIPAVVVGAGAFWLSYKNLSKSDWLALTGVSVIALLALLFDNDICNVIPSGSHFIWHGSAAYILYRLGNKVSTLS